MKKEIENRADVFFLVDTFYTKIRADDLLGPIFNGVIDDWPSHLERLTDFWETNLFFVNKFKGLFQQVFLIESVMIIDNRHIEKDQMRGTDSFNTSCKVS